MIPPQPESNLPARPWNLCEIRFFPIAETAHLPFFLSFFLSAVSRNFIRSFLQSRADTVS
jgi:hypothetical protein